MGLCGTVELAGHRQTQLGKNRHVHEPQGTDHLLDDCVVQRIENPHMEVNVQCEEGLAFLGGIGHGLGKLHETRLFAAGKRYDHFAGASQVQKPAQLYDILQVCEILADRHHGSECERFHHRIQGQRAHEGALAVFHFDDVERFELAHGLAHGGAGGSDRVAQLCFSGHHVAGLQVLAQDVGLDRVHRLVTATASGDCGRDLQRQSGQHSQFPLAVLSLRGE